MLSRMNRVSLVPMGTLKVCCGDTTVRVLVVEYQLVTKGLI